MDAKWPPLSCSAQNTMFLAILHRAHQIGIYPTSTYVSRGPEKEKKEDTRPLGKLEAPK